MITCPPATPVTTPVPLTVAIDELELDHGVVASGVAEPVSVIELPVFTVDDPVILGGEIIVPDKDT